jgi:hypothetical protein
MFNLSRKSFANLSSSLDVPYSGCFLSFGVSFRRMVVSLMEPLFVGVIFCDLNTFCLVVPVVFFVFVVVRFFVFSVKSLLG